MLLDEGDIELLEIRREQARRPYMFVNKLRRRRSAHDLHPTEPASAMSLETFGQVYSAADFAAELRLPLDVLVTVDLQRIGATCAKTAADEVRRFIKSANDWLWGQRYIPAAWIYAIENGTVGFHAHVAMHVPGVPPNCQDVVVDYRALFREWAKGYTDRRFGAHIPRAVYVRAPKRESWLRHWINVSYLMKGYDRFAIVRSPRNTSDNRSVYLGDLVATPYVSPGVVDVPFRVRVSHSLGPARRAIGVPAGLECCLPKVPNWSVFEVDRTKPLSLVERLNTSWTLPKAAPFQSRWEAGCRDVRELYPAEFYRFVTKQEPFCNPRPSLGANDTLLCQLQEMADPVLERYRNPLL